MSDGANLVERPASQPDADLACDFTIAVSEVGLRERLGARAIARAEKIEDGVKMAFKLEAWDDVQRYIAVESKCYRFLSLTARKSDDRVELTVTGRAEAQGLIVEMFSSRSGASG